MGEATRRKKAGTYPAKTPTAAHTRPIPTPSIMASERAKQYNPSNGLNAHWRVAEVAQQMANELWPIYARDNEFYRHMRAGGQITEDDARIQFVMRMTPKLLEDAREMLAECLNSKALSDKEKMEVHEALVLDNDLRAGRIKSTASLQAEHEARVLH